MAVSPPPCKPAASPPASSDRQPLAENKLDAIINRGSSPVAAGPPVAVPLKNFNIKLPAGTLASIDEVRAMRPRKPTSPKLGISTQDWLLEAIAEKLAREQKQYAPAAR